MRRVNHRISKDMAKRLSLLLPLLAGGALLAAVGLTCYFSGTYVGQFTRDPQVITGQSPLVGFVSTIGCGAWCVAFAVNMLAWLCTFRDRPPGRASKLAFLGYGGLLSLALLLDDQFQLHEYVLPRYLGISEVLVTAAYLIATVTYVLVFQQRIRDVGAAPLVASLSLFALSILIDQAPEGLSLIHI